MARQGGNRQSNAPKYRADLTLHRDRLIFGRTVNHRDATLFRRLVHKGMQSGKTGYTFDFGATTYASPVAMAQLVVQAESFRREGMALRRDRSRRQEDETDL